MEHLVNHTEARCGLSTASSLSRDSRAEAEGKPSAPHPRTQRQQASQRTTPSCIKDTAGSGALETLMAACETGGKGVFRPAQGCVCAPRMLLLPAGQ